MIYDMIRYDIFVNCNWVDTRWQQCSTHLHTNSTQNSTIDTKNIYRDADKFLARPGRKQATATEDFEIHISYL
jgi:hypothetical protein